jgi:hypothetical protein
MLEARIVSVKLSVNCPRSMFRSNDRTSGLRWSGTTVSNGSAAADVTTAGALSARSRSKPELYARNVSDALASVARPNRNVMALKSTSVSVIKSD